MLTLVIPKGSLEKATFELFEAADLGIKRYSAVDYKAIIDDPRILHVRILRPQEIPIYVANGLFDIGITGRDWVLETGALVETVGTLNYSKNTSNTIRLVLAVAQESSINSKSDIKGPLRVSTEYPRLSEQYFRELDVEAEILLSYGATEAKIPEICDAVIEITETGSALRAAGLKIVDELLKSDTQLIANPDSFNDPVKRHAMDQIYSLLSGALEARDKVLLKLNVDTERLDQVLASLPSLKAPTISELAGGGAFAIETVVKKSEINILIPELIDKGATDLLEIPLSKIIR